MPNQPLPEADEIREVLHGLLGRDMIVRTTHPASIDPAAKTITASYLRDDGSVGAAVVSDIEVAAFAGAALALIPKGVANDCVKDGELTEMLADNFHEVLNVASAWFNGRGAPHVSLGEVTDPGARPAPNAQTVVANHAERTDFDVEVDGYGKGVLRFLSVAY